MIRAEGVGADQATLRSSAKGCEAAKTGHLGCIWCIEAAGFAAGSQPFADKSAPTKTEISRTSEASPGPLPRPTGSSLKATFPGSSGLMYNDERWSVGMQFVVLSVTHSHASVINTQSAHPPSARCSTTGCSHQQHLRR
ncbi:hypothetical protein CU666_17790 [Pseudomonas syringae pv. actinidifoliorum]|nr:hypothetical protein [Pseudomonas syringae pv. actinidifoliorum]